MFEQLLNLVKEQAGESIIKNPAIPDERNDEAVNHVAGSITDGLKDALSNGQFKDVLKLLGGEGGDLQQNPLANQLSGNTITSLMEKFGINQSQAGSIVSNLLPGVLKNLVNKTNDPSDNSIDLQGIFSSLTGGKSNGLDLQGLLGKVTSGGLDQDGDGDTDLQDVMNMFKGGGKQGGGSILDSVKGLFG